MSINIFVSKIQGILNDAGFSEFTYKHEIMKLEGEEPYHYHGLNARTNAYTGDEILRLKSFIFNLGYLTSYKESGINYKIYTMRIENNEKQVVWLKWSEYKKSGVNK